MNLKRFKSVKCRNLMKKATENIRRRNAKNVQTAKEVGKSGNWREQVLGENKKTNHVLILFN